MLTMNNKKFLLVFIFSSVFFSLSSAAFAVEITDCKSNGASFQCEVGKICTCTVSGACTNGNILVYKTVSSNLLCTPQILGSTSQISWNNCNNPTDSVKVEASCDEGQSSERTIAIISGSTTTTTTPQVQTGCSYDNPCTADCGKLKMNQETSTQNYYEFTLDTTSNVTVRMIPQQNVDYDVYVDWDGNKPTMDDYDCRSQKDRGIVEECKIPNQQFSTPLEPGTYYIMINYLASYSQGTGSYNLSLTCTPTEPVTLSCSNEEKPCKIDCGKSKVDRSTNNQDYYMFQLTSKSNVAVKLYPISGVDYDLYVNWDGTKPTTDENDCKPSYGRGENEECKIPNQQFSTPLEPGTYYVMVDHYEGSGNYDLSLSCVSIGTTTTAPTTVATTVSSVASTVSSVASTTTRPITTIEQPSTCGIDGYCVGQDEGCSESYEHCSNYNDECAAHEICCCLKTTHGFNYQIIVGLFLTVVLVVLVYFYIKGKSTMTYEKLYKKWTRIIGLQP
jgi:hypothetical protein